MASKSAKSVFDFLRLVRSWLRIVAASGVNFAKVWRPEQNFVLARIVRRRFPPDRRALLQVVIAIPALFV
jgi:hypothetical protein